RSPRPPRGRGHTLYPVSGGGTTDPPPKLRSKTPVIAAQAGATLTVTVALSFLGVAGTMAGLVAGTLISQVSAFWYEQWVRRVHARARRHVAQYRARRVPGQSDGWDDYYRPPASSRPCQLRRSSWWNWRRLSRCLRL